jgi:hypothetical protein
LTYQALKHWEDWKDWHKHQTNWLGCCNNTLTRKMQTGQLVVNYDILTNFIDCSRSVEEKLKELCVTDGEMDQNQETLNEEVAAVIQEV